jgi:threonyl-tRNA synthetase
MYNLELREDEKDEHPENYTLKPMNCPESTILYRFRPRTYKELPLRLAEIGRLHRREKSGEVNGLLRVRQLTMDDAHIYARESQIFDDVSNILDMMITFYKNFGFEYEFRFATRPETRAGTDEDWDKAEKGLEEVLKKKGIKAGDKKGDGAFYGPKIDLHIKDALERDWQLATVQLDFHMPQAFDLKYVNEKGEFEKPVMIHRAIFGSFERFIGILTEHFQGAFPLWLSPVQISLLPITDAQNDYANEVAKKLRAEGIRVEVDTRNERLQAKIRDATLQKVPYLGIIGKQEVESKSVTLRLRDGKDLGKLEINDLIVRLKQEIDKKI